MFRLIGKGLLLFCVAWLAAGCEPTAEPENNPAFSTLSQQVQGQQQVVAGYPIKFPQDHASHPEFAIEWWYITANLTDQAGTDYGVQWTLFRFLSDAKENAWANQQQYMAHVALHDAKQSWFEERFARGGVGNAGVKTEPFHAFLDNWSWQSQGQTLFPSTLVFTAENQVAAELELTASKQFVLHGEQGYSIKLANAAQASYYYSQPHIQVSGKLIIQGEKKAVTGQAWFDHEWTSQYLDDAGLGWDWFSIHLDSGKKLMLFNVRHQTYGDFWSGTLVQIDDTSIHLTPADIEANIANEAIIQGRTFPVSWKLSLPKYDLELTTKPIKTDQLHPGLFSYYEGAIRISGSDTGIGFMELTGY